jgi:hypothetical protein
MLHFVAVVDGKQVARHLGVLNRTEGHERQV